MEKKEVSVAAEPAKKEEKAPAVEPAKDQKPKKEKKDKKEKKERKEQKKKEPVDEVFVKDPSDPCASKYGDMELNKSQCDPEVRFKKIYTPVEEITEAMTGKELLVRARLHNSRIKSKKLGFLVLRERFGTIQAILIGGPAVSEGMIKYAKSIPKESLLDVIGVVSKPGEDIKGCTQKVELVVSQLFTVAKSSSVLPFQIEDASNRVEHQEEEDIEEKKEEKKEPKKDKEGKEEKKEIRVGQMTRLDNRVMDLRVPANQALMRLQSGVGRYFREFLYKNDFVEIHTPKINPGVSEGGTQVFRLSYFGKDACLAQSPQLYKQMAICGDITRVFEIAPVFRAENANTNRHLCEFTMMDVEMAFKDHYFEVMDMLGNMFNYIFEQLDKNCQSDLKVIDAQYPFTKFKWLPTPLKMNFLDGVKMLNEAGNKQDPTQDLDTESEKLLGELVKKKYDTDFYILYGYPVAARPFYTMPDPKNPGYTNSYDFFMRGEEIISGAQRIHDPKFLTEQIEKAKIPVHTLKDYIESFKYGAPPHAGCGIGLERVVKLFAGIKNIRKCIMFTRDPKRLSP